MKAPHILIASSNPYRLVQNLAALLDKPHLDKLDQEIKANALQLGQLGVSHLVFAKSIGNSNWRQIISRLYYAAYNMTRAVRFIENGAYSTDSSDHKKVGELPVTFPNVQRYINQLPSLRDDRNLCDYDHTATVGDLSLPVTSAISLVDELYNDLKIYFATKGVTLKWRYSPQRNLLRS